MRQLAFRAFFVLGILLMVTSCSPKKDPNFQPDTINKTPLVED